ncbi:hypothetical protein [Singulisphaera sp. PoT]|uniref:hypothetical protein n=1 Tax=Singulisphaera sp. PoT TaxID=3411797 RepID=UPI003BF6181E
MIDFHRTVGEIRSFLQSADRTEDPRLAGLAKDYAAACSEANERLNRCAFFLRQGLRSEALHLAKAEPDLLDMATVLDFPERPEWDDLALRYGWTKAPALAIDHAHALNEAYGEEDPLQDLLRKHRRYALARAPLLKRVEVMRKIAQLDTNNPIWLEDIRRFEVARQDEMELEVRNARAAVDVTALEAIVRELETVAWTAPLAEARVNSARSALASARKQQARNQLGKLAEDLQRAHAGEDTARGRQIRSRWLALAEMAALSPGDPLEGEAQAGLDWLRRQDRREEEERAYQEAMLDLQDVLEHGGDRRTLNEAEEGVIRFGRGLPKDIQAAVKERYRELGKSERRKFRTIVTGIAAALLVFAGLIAWSSAAGNRLRTIEQTASKIEEMLEAGQLKEARQALEQLEKTYPGASETKACEAVTNRLAGAEKDEDGRVDRFNKALKAAQDAPLDEEAPPALATARMAARLPGEKAALERVEGDRKALGAKMRGEADEALQSRLRELSEKLEAAERLVAQLPKSNETREALGGLRIHVTTLRNEAEKASPEPKAQALAWIARLEKAESALAGNSDRERMVELVREKATAMITSGDAAPFAEACEAYVVKFPGDPRSAAFRDMLAERSAWETLIAWALIAKGWKPPYTKLTPADATERSQQLTEFRIKHPRWPDATMGDYHRYVMAMSRREPKGEDDATAPLRRVLSNPLFQNIWKVQATNGKTYYTVSKPDVTENGCLFEALVTLAGRTDRVYLTKENVESIAVAPQAKMAGRLKPMVTQAVNSPANWDEVMGQIFAAIQSEPEVDSIPRMIALRAAMRTATLGSELISEALKEQSRAVQDPALNLDVDWMAPERPEVERLRDSCERILKGLPPITLISTLVEKARVKLEASMAQTYLPVDVLLRTSKGAWQCDEAAKCRPGTSLFVNLSDGSWETIGKVLGPDKGVLIDGAAAKLLEGRLVFARRTSE